MKISNSKPLQLFHIAGCYNISPLGAFVLDWINGVLDVDPGYLRLHHKTMQANWHQYMECTSMRAGNTKPQLKI